MTRLGTVDVLIVVLYVVGTTLLGGWFSRKQRDLRTYFVGDRNVSWWLVLVSIVATETSTVTFLSVPGLAFDREAGNLTFLQLAFGYVLGRVLIAWLLLPQYFRGELFSAYQLLRERFDVRVQRTASGLFLITRTVADGLRLFLTGLLLHHFTDWNVPASILVMGAATILYTYLGGMQAVIWTDLIQFVIYILGAVLAGVFIVDLLPGGVEQLVTVGAEAGQFTIIDAQFQRQTPYNLWAGLIGGAFFTMASHGADQLMVQRYLCSRSLGQARVAVVLSGVVVLLQFMLFLLIGVGLFALYRAGLLPLRADARNDEVFGAFIVNHLPAGLVGVVIAAVLAAAMSTLSSSLNSSANALVTDFYKPLRPGADERHFLALSKGLTLFFGVAQVAVALAAWLLDSPRAIVDQVLGVAGFTMGVILGIFLLGIMKRPVTSTAALLGLLAGFVAVTVVWLPSTWGTTLLAWPWYAPVGALTTVTVALAAHRLSPSHGSPANRGPQPGLDQTG